ncbi:MAG: hypothetical protein HYX21_02550 [Candidatus Yanofskybacteria bacterium]|nr:hypothetical protein [Candidatus Yanofskybacteria bacterium]
MTKKIKLQDGQILIFAAIILGVMVLTSISLQAILLSKLRLSAEVKNSVGAAFAAESGLEWCLYNNQISPSPTPWPAPIMANGSTYQVFPPDCTGEVLKSIGTYKGVVRSFEASF